MNPKRHLILLVILLISGMLAHNSVMAADVDPPQLVSLSFNTTQATIGEVVTLTVQATDAGEVTYVYIEYATVDQFDNYFYIGWNSTSNVAGGIAQFDFDVVEFMPDTELIVSYVYLEDNSTNTVDLYNGEHFASPVVDLYDTNPDYDPPELLDVYFDQSVATNNTDLWVYVDAEDDKSGVGDVYVELYKLNEDTGEENYFPWENEYVTSQSLYYNATTDLWEGSFYIWDYWSTGTYFIGYVDIGDNRGNWMGYDDDHPDYSVDDFVNIYVGPADYNAPNLNGPSAVWIDRDYVFPGVPITIFVDAFDDVSGVAEVTTTIVAQIIDDGSNYTAYYDDVELFYNSGIGVWQGTILTNADEEFLDQQLWVDEVTIRDEAFNYVHFGYPSYNWTTFEISKNAPQPAFIDMSISTNGDNEPGSTVFVTVDFYSNTSEDLEGYISLDVIAGPDVYPISSNLIYVSPFSDYSRTYEITFNRPGVYLVEAWFENEYGFIVSTSSEWEVLPGDQSLLVEAILIEGGEMIDSDRGQSVEGETVEFEISITSTFYHNMPNVMVDIELVGEDGISNVIDNFSVRVNEQSTKTERIDITFEEAGQYTLNIIAYDDMRTGWSFSLFWEVLPVNGTGGSGNNSIAPEIDLPGFELPLTLLTFGFIFIATYARKHRSQ